MAKRSATVRVRMSSVDRGAETLGLSLVFDLLRDKIDIAAGDLAFPYCGMPGDEDLPPLWKEEEEGGEDE